MVRLELRLIADVGLVGLPNAGKSSLLTALTAARPRIAAYPFTTLDPELGVLEREDGTRMVLADMPGLIEGASMGVGLGLRFLRHIERTRVLLYVVDGSDPEPWADLETVRQEVRSYSAELSGRPALIAVNKVDLDEACRFRERSRAGADVLFVSALTGEGLDVLTQALAETLDTAPSAPQAQPDRARAIRLPEVRHRDPGFSVERQPWGFALSGRRIERLVERTDFESGAALDRFQVVLDRMGVSRALEMAGATPGDTVRIGDLEFEYQP